MAGAIAYGNMPEAMGEVIHDLSDRGRVLGPYRRDRKPGRISWEASERAALAYSARTALRFSSGLRSGTGVGMLEMQRANMYSVFIVLSSAALEKAP